MLMDRGYLFDNRAVIRAVMNGHIDAAEYLISKNFFLNAPEIYKMIIVRYGEVDSNQQKMYIDVLSWMYMSCGIPLNETHYYNAIKMNCFELVELLHRLDCPWNEFVFLMAAVHPPPYRTHISDKVLY